MRAKKLKPIEGMPDFLRISQEARNETWAKNPPKPPTLVEAPKPPAPIQAPPMAPKTKARLAEGKARKKVAEEFHLIPAEYRRWDPRRSKFVDERVDYTRRLKAAAEKLGIILEDDMKFKIVPYIAGQTLPYDRAATSISVTAPQWERDDKIKKAALRAGKKLERVEVVDHQGALTATWTVDSEKKSLHNQATGTSISLTEEQAQPVTETQEEADMASKSKKVSKANGSSKKAGEKKPGVIATIVETMKRDRGASADEILAVLVKKFPDRTQKGMMATVRIQANRNAKKKDKDEKRGGVVYFA